MHSLWSPRIGSRGPDKTNDERDDLFAKTIAE
jgi:hypothetical protein